MRKISKIRNESTTRLQADITRKSSWYQTADIQKPLDNWLIAGRGKKTNGNCTKFIRWDDSASPQKALKVKAQSCKVHIHETFKAIKFSCKKLGCPDCFSSGALRASERIRRKLFQFYRMTNYKNLPKHVSINIQWKREIVDDIKKFDNAKRKLYKQFESVGIEAGILIFHPYRIRCACGTKGTYNKKTKRMGCAGCDDYTAQLYYSPHFHGLVYSDFIRGAEVFQELGFTVRVIEKNDGTTGRKFGKTTSYMMDEVQATLYYQLTHTGIKKKPNCDTYWYFGELAPRKMSIDEKKSEDIPVLCPVCKEKIYWLIDGFEVELNEDGSVSYDIDKTKLTFDDYVTIKVDLTTFKFSKHSKYAEKEQQYLDKFS